MGVGIEEVMTRLGDRGFHGARDPVEGAVWRVERKELVRPGKSSERRTGSWTSSSNTFVQTRSTAAIYRSSMVVDRTGTGSRFRKAADRVDR